MEHAKSLMPPSTPSMMNMLPATEKGSRFVGICMHMRTPVVPCMYASPSMMREPCGILPDQYVAGACFYYAVAQSLHAISSNAPLDSASPRAKAIAVFRDMCGLSIQESALSVNRDLEKDTWRGQPQGGMPEHFVALAKHVDGSVVLLRSNRFSIVTSGFGIDSALTSAAVWVPGRENPLHFHDRAATSRITGDVGGWWT